MEKSLLKKKKDSGFSLGAKDVVRRYGMKVEYVFKGRPPFTAGPNDTPMGVLVQNPETGEIACNECPPGNIFWGKNLTPHLHKEHNMTTTEFREKWGLAFKQGLCSPEVSRRRSDASRKRKKPIVNPMLSLKKEIKKQKPYRTPKSVQALNRSDHCAAQLGQREIYLVDYLYDLDKSLAKRLEAASVVEPKFFGWLIENRYAGRIGIFASAWKLDRQWKPEQKIYPGALIHSLRLYVLRHNAVPWSSWNDSVRGNCFFPYEIQAYRYIFGSWAKIMAACSIYRVRSKKELKAKLNYMTGAFKSKYSLREDINELMDLKNDEEYAYLFKKGDLGIGMSDFYPPIRDSFRSPSEEEKGFEEMREEHENLTAHD